MASKIHASRAKFNDFIWSRNKRKDESKTCSSPTHSSSSHSSAASYLASANETTECAQEALVNSTPLTSDHLSIKSVDDSVCIYNNFL